MSEYDIDDLREKGLDKLTKAELRYLVDLGVDFEKFFEGESDDGFGSGAQEWTPSPTFDQTRYSFGSGIIERSQKEGTTSVLNSLISERRITAAELEELIMTPEKRAEINKKVDGGER